MVLKKIETMKYPIMKNVAKEKYICIVKYKLMLTNGVVVWANVK